MQIFNGISICSCMILLSFQVLRSDAVCERPNQLIGAEDLCWAAKVEVVDRIQHTSKSVFNFAKKKLGMDVDEEAKPQKCEYYQCIFQQLKVLDAQNFPNFERLQIWIENNVIYRHAVNLFERENMCNHALRNNTASDTYFSGDLSDNIQEAELGMPSLQSDCEIAAEFMKCLALTDKNCMIFQFP